LVNGSKYIYGINCEAKITSIEKNVIGYDGKLGFSEI
jgi:hypothetical protein